MLIRGGKRQVFPAYSACRKYVITLRRNWFGEISSIGCGDIYSSRNNVPEGAVYKLLFFLVYCVRRGRHQPAANYAYQTLGFRQPLYGILAFHFSHVM